jgi:hypothetical protein
MPLESPGLNAAADGFKANYTWVALYTSGDVELSGAGYVRKQVTWSASANGDISMSGTQVFDVAAGQDVAKFGVHSAASGGTRGAYEPLSATEPTYAADGTYQLDSLTLDID